MVPSGIRTILVSGLLVLQVDIVVNNIVRIAGVMISDFRIHQSNQMVHEMDFELENRVVIHGTPGPAYLLTMVFG
jgi:hypothetical protein